MPYGINNGRRNAGNSARFGVGGNWRWAVDNDARRPLKAPTGGFTPASVPGLALWLDATRLTGLNDGDPVQTWPDLSGGGNPLTQATLANRPTYRTNVRNGLPVVRFDGVDDALSNGTVAAPVSQPVTAYVVARSSGGRVVDGDAVGRLLIGTAASYQLFAGALLTGGTTDAAWHTLSGKFSGASSSLIVDGAAVITGDAGANAYGGLRLGNDSALSSPLNGDVGEVIVCPAPSAPVDAQIVAYLKAKWGTP